MDFFEFIKWRTKIFTIGILWFFTSVKAKMRLKREINCSVYGKDAVSTNMYQEMVWKNFDREFYRLKIRRAPSGRPRLIQKKLRCWWTKILILLLDILLVIFRSHLKVFLTIFTTLIKSTDSTVGCPTHRGHLTEAQLARWTVICNLLIEREKNHHF